MTRSPLRRCICFAIFALPAIARADSLSDKLLLAVAKGDLAGARTALDEGADVNASSQSEAIDIPLTALSLSVLRQSAEMRELLLSRGADPKAYSFLALRMAILQSHAPSVLDFLRVSPGLPGDSDLLILLLNRPRSEGRDALRVSILSELKGNDVDATDKTAPWNSLLPDFARDPSDPAITIASALLDAGISVNTETETFGDRETAISLAVENGDVFLGKFLISRGAQVDGDRNLDVDLLVSASSVGNVGGVQKLLAEDVDVNVADYLGRFALAESISTASVIPSLLLAQNADPNRAGEVQHLPIVLAAERNAQELITLLLQKGADPNRKGLQQEWAMRAAARAGWVDTMQQLLTAGALINLVDNDGRTVLHDFVLTSLQEPSAEVRRITLEQMEVLKLLASAGFNFAARDKRNRTILHSVVDHRKIQYEFLEALVRAGAPIDAGTIFGALEQYDALLLDWLLSKGGDPNVTRPWGTSLLEEAFDLIYRNARLPEVVAKHGALLPAEEGQRSQLMIVAARYGAAVLLEAILKRGADPNAYDGSRSALEAALFEGKAENLQLLAEHGANLTRVDSSGSTVLHRLVQQDVVRRSETDPVITSSHESAIAVLVDKGFDLSAKDDRGRTIFDVAGEFKPTLDRLRHAVGLAGKVETPLHRAVRADDIKEVEKLIASGADLSSEDGLRRTPLALALSLQRDSVAETLLRAGSPISYLPSVPFLAADIEFASSKRLAPAFATRVLSQQLLSLGANDARKQPQRSIQKFQANSNFKVPDLRWTISCARCSGQLTLAGNTKHEFLKLQSTRVEGPDSASFRLVQYNITPVFILGEITFTVHGDLTISPCDFDGRTDPTCYPETIVENTDKPTGLRIVTASGSEVEFPTTTVTVAQNGRATVIPSGETGRFDRSLGLIEVSVGPVEAKSFSIGTSVKINQGPSTDITGDITGGLDLSSRMRTYTRIAVLRAELTALQENPIEGSAVRSNTIIAAIHMLSARAVQEKYLAHVRELVIAHAKYVADLDDGVLKLRNLIISSSELTAEKIDVLIRRVDQLLETAGSSEEQEALLKIRKGLTKMRAATDATGKSVRLFRDQFETYVDQVIRDYQALALEFAQFVPVTDLAREAALPSGLRESIRNKLCGHDVAIHDSAFQGKGARVREVFGLPRPDACIER